MTNDRNVLKIVDAVTTILQNHSGRNWPNRIPIMMAMMSLGSNPSLNFFFSIDDTTSLFFCVNLHKFSLTI